MMGVLKKLLGVFVFVMVALLIPKSVNAEKMSDEFKSYLNEDGKLVINSVKLESGLEFVFEYMFAMDENFEYINNGDSGICWDIAEDKNSVDFTINCRKPNEETHNVEIFYNYDKKVQKTFEQYFKNFPKDKKYFKIVDMELINYWVNNAENADSNSLDYYSGELKSYLNHNNIHLVVDNRAGGWDWFSTSRLGVATFRHNGIIYYLDETLGTRAEYVIYVPDETGSTADELMEAAQQRIDDYIGEGKVSIEYGDVSVYNFYMETYDNDILIAQSELDAEMSKPENERDPFKVMTLQNSLDWAKQYKQNFIEDWNKSDGEYSYLKEAAGGQYFYTCVGGMCQPTIIVKDSSKMINPSIKTADASTDIEISTNELLPLDTSIQAKQLTSGDEYERIIKLLNINDNLTFDLRLYSESLGQYVTQLADGTFKVRIPLPEDFKNRDLKIYYVGADGKPEEFDVKFEENKKYAVFTTNHFSIYTLAAEGEAPSEKVPNTFDGIGKTLIIGLLSLLGVIGGIFCLNKKIKLKVK